MIHMKRLLKAQNLTLFRLGVLYNFLVDDATRL